MYIAIVLAQEPATPGEDGPSKSNDQKPGGGFLGGNILIPLLLIFVLMYFIMIRPQRKQQKQRQLMLDQMRKNDRVVTIGGIEGVIYSVDDDKVVLKIDERNDVRITVAKSAVGRIVAGDEEEEKAGR